MEIVDDDKIEQVHRLQIELASGNDAKREALKTLNEMLTTLKNKFPENIGDHSALASVIVKLENGLVEYDTALAEARRLTSELNLDEVLKEVNHE